MRRERPRPSGTIRKARTPYRAIPLVLLILILGIFPGLLLDMINQSVNQFVEHVMTNGRLLSQ